MSWLLLILPVKSLPFPSVHFRKYEFVILRSVRNEFQVVFRSRLPTFFFHNTSHFQKKSNIVSRNTVEMCVVRCKGNSVIFSLLEERYKDLESLHFHIQILGTVSYRTRKYCMNVTRNNLALTNFMYHNFFTRSLQSFIQSRIYPCYLQPEDSIETFARSVLLTVCQVSSIQLVISYPVSLR